VCVKSCVLNHKHHETLKQKSNPL